MKSLLKKYLPIQLIIKILCLKDLIKKIHIMYTDELPNESVKITVSFSNNKKELYIDLPKEIDINKRNGRRLKKCMILWLPYILSLQRERKSSFSITLNASDLGDQNILSMDSINNKNLIPDEFSMEDYLNNKYDMNEISFEKFRLEWMNRKHIIFWRGSSTGKKIQSIEDLKALNRVSLCLKYNNSENINLKISRIVQSDLPERTVNAWLESQNIKGSIITENKFKDYCYYPDIKGNALAWGTIRKLQMGILIFRPDHSRYLFYYNIIKPWVHYIPVKSDYSDLEEKYKWAEKNITEAVEIAYNGYLASNNYIKNIPRHFKQAMTNHIDKQII